MSRRPILWLVPEEKPETDLAPLLAASVELAHYRKRDKALEAFFAVWDRYVANDVSVTEHDVARAMREVRGVK